METNEYQRAVIGVGVALQFMMTPVLILQYYSFIGRIDKTNNYDEILMQE